MPRIVTMIASATEIVCALGFEKDLIARSHECDYPPSVLRLPVCTAPSFDVHGSSMEIDQHVKTLLQESASIYRIDAELLRQLQPDVIVTQGQCDVFAVSEKDVEKALLPWLDKKPRVVSLSPNNLAEVWQSIEQTADALDAPHRGRQLTKDLQERMERIATKASAQPRQTVACLEWIEPLMAAGNWVPELVERAGGQNVVGSAGKHSPWLSWEQLQALDPDIIIAMPCGFDLAKTRQEMASLTKVPGWQNLRAVQNHRVFAVDGNQFFNRPGPRLVESLEILAEIIHPSVFRFGHAASGFA